MNYRHAFHAGNFADVHKHCALIALLDALQKKPAPFFVLDTHAGSGRYDLNSHEAQRSGEWREGVGRLRAAATLSHELSRYLTLSHPNPREYLGSPLIIASQLRVNDRAVFVERHPEEAAALKRALGQTKRIAVCEGDGYAQLKAHLPPKENRGFVLLDPPYEKESEFVDAAAALRIAHARWPNGILCIWYPIKSDNAERTLHRELVAAQIRRILLIEFYVRPKDSPIGLNGSGMLLINPPWQFDDRMRALLTELHRLLALDGCGSSRVEWMVGE